MHYKQLLLTLTAATAIGVSAGAQTLFTCNGKPVSRQEFLTAFNKNPDTTGSRAEKVTEYLDMYINFKLKLAQAYAERLDAKEEFKEEGANFKKQIADNYINEQANISRLVHEAFVRSQKDILLAEVFVANGTDTAAARQKINEALSALNKGKSFDEVTTTYSTDEAIKAQKGSMGYITVFTLPYEVENMVYALKPGEHTGVYHSTAGYHIFKNISERPAAGKRKIQQVLLPIAPGSSAEEKLALKQKADSIYQLIAKGAQFDDMVAEFSSQQGAQTRGMTTVGVGMYSSDFEQHVFALTKPNEVAAPFETSYGFNIIKLLSIEPVADKDDDVMNTAALQQSIESDGRLGAARDNLYGRWLGITGYKKGAYNEQDLFHYADSALTHMGKISYKGINGQTVLFSFPKKSITVSDWITYLQFEQQASSIQKQYTEQLKSFTKQAVSNYYRDHIEDYNPQAGVQLKEFNEANLLFAVMDEHVWSKATQDTIALQKYYNEHAKNYVWAPGITALVVSAQDKAVLDSLLPLIKANPANWRNITGTLATADSSRYEAGQYPVKQQVPMQAGYTSSIEKTDAGDSYTFLYVFNVYPNPSPRNFDDARGMVINDYQQVLEATWIAELKKKYPVVINQEVLKGLK